ncbi:hypothetical protein [Nocardia sp. NBC_01009]|uniref:hypothetical protein n=1 Tax=Nocardia sp. NBC_01009 TaxID=2975996 RepID=UPI00386CD08F|nr:hypothetical protein OHA42_04970 [Nocardia sp. NBC_01009]
MPWATAQNVRDRWIGPGPFPADITDAMLGVLVDDVEDSILAEFPDMQQRIDDYATPPTPPTPQAIPQARVVKVVCRVILRHVRNPEGVRTKSEGLGPFPIANTYGGNDPGTLYLTAEDREELAGLGSLGGGQKAFTVDTIPVRP